tara:strand:+ start:1761 stop:2465 length:705 start_codon:yes stop_codon:yes gene_type:complete
MKNNKTIPPFLFLRPNPVKGHGEFNGYVSLPIGHPWYGKHFTYLDVDVHYGLSFSEEEDGRWVIGFDTAHTDDELRNWDRENVRKEASRLLDQAESAERWEREQEKLEQEQERQAELECHERREEGRHWYNGYTEAVPLDLWELFRAITYEIHGKINHELLMETVSHHSTRSDKLDAYRIYPTRGDGILTAGSSFKLIVGIRYGMGVGDYDSPFVTNETAALFNLDPLNRDNDK